MGIDIYMRWAQITPTQRDSQYQGHDVTIGELGYLREAYHGEPYATRLLMPEAFDAHGAPVTIPAATLRDRLPQVMKAAMRREREIYNSKEVNEDNEAVQSFVSFVELAERLESEGQAPVITASY